MKQKNTIARKSQKTGQNKNGKKLCAIALHPEAFLSATKNPQGQGCRKKTKNYLHNRRESPNFAPLNHRRAP